MSAALSDTEAEMLTRGREPVDKSSAQKQLFSKNCNLQEKITENSPSNKTYVKYCKWLFIF